MIKPYTPPQEITEVQVKKAIGAEAYNYLGVNTNPAGFPTTAYDGQYTTYPFDTADPIYTGLYQRGIYEYTNQAWTRVVSPRGDMVANAVIDVVILVYEGFGTMNEYLTLGEEFTTALASLMLTDKITANATAKSVFVGLDAGSTSPSTATNITCIGYNSQVTGSNQLQLGDSSTTTYAYGAVQDRSDKRDKADIQPTKLGIDFIKKLKPVDFKWDYREDYKTIKRIDKPKGVIEYQITQLPKDGSKKRKRFHHGLIAQDVKEVMDEMGIDFGGYQDHSINGGGDVLSLGYEELIAPMIKAIQEQQKIIEDLEMRIKKLGG